MRLFASFVWITVFASSTFISGMVPIHIGLTADHAGLTTDHLAADPSTAARSVAGQGSINPPYVAPYSAPTTCQINPTQLPAGWPTSGAGYAPFTQALENSPAIANPVVIPQSQQGVPPPAPVKLNVTEVSTPMVVTQRALTVPFQLLYGLVNGSGVTTPQYPGPTIRVTSDLLGQPVRVPQTTTPPNLTQLAVTNGLTLGPNVPFPYITTHLHGGHTAPEHDGHPSDLLPPNPTGTGFTGTTKMTPDTHVYSYTNDQQPQILWYHDHADMNTNPHVAQGLYAFYIIQENPDDPKTTDQPLPQYDIPLRLQSEDA